MHLGASQHCWPCQLIEKELQSCSCASRSQEGAAVLAQLSLTSVRTSPEEGCWISHLIRKLSYTASLLPGLCKAALPLLPQVRSTETQRWDPGSSPGTGMASAYQMGERNLILSEKFYRYNPKRMQLYCHNVCFTEHGLEKLHGFCYTGIGEGSEMTWESCLIK